MRPKAGGRRRKIWKASKDVWKPCNPLKSHKTAKDLFGKRLGGRLYSATLAPSHQRPPIKRDRHCEERSDEATRGSVTRPLGCFAALGLSIRKSGRPVSSNGTGWRTVRNSQ